MDWKELVQAALTLVVRFAVVWLFELIGFELDPALLDTLVAAIVTFLLGLFLYKAGALGARKVRALFAKG